MKKLFILFAATLFLANLNAQCTTTNISGDYTQSSDIILSGIINVTGTYTLPAGITITVPSYGLDNCGSLTINAANIIIHGNIIADGSGYLGGTGGLGATTVTSITGHENGLTGCVDKDNPGQITVGGGLAGSSGNGPGAGSQGSNGTVGSGTKQVCGTVGDEAGLIGGAGGAGGGAGGSYGGDGTPGLAGGNGIASGTISGESFSNAYTPIAGIGGIGGNIGTSYGTINGTDIDLGSGGAGGGGGGRSFYVGENGAQGGHGGGMIKLNASDSLVVSGTLSVNGQNGGAGGKGGNGDRTSDCCSDACNDCAERTFTAGAGGGSGSGGGSGGGIYLSSSDKIVVTGNLSSVGGTGGIAGLKGNGASCTYSDWICGDVNVSTDAGNDGSWGGSGSGGRIKIFATNCPTNVITPTHTEDGGNGAADGTYAVIISGCPDFVGMENEFGTLVAQIFPNPADDILNIKIDAFSLNMKDAELMIYDVNGKLLFNTFMMLEKGNSIQIPVSKFANGVYTVVLRNNITQATYKFIKD